MISQAESRLRPLCRWLGAAAVVACAAIAPPVAWAAPAPDAVGQALTAAVAATGETKLTYGSASGSGDDVTLTDVKLTRAEPAAATAAPAATAGATPAAPPSVGTVSIPALVFSGVADRAGGGFTAAHLAFDKGSTVARGETIAWASGSVDDVVIPSAAEVTARAKVQPFDKFSLAGITVSGAHLAEPITIDAVSGTIGNLTGATPAAVHWEAHAIKLDSALLANSFLGAFISLLDYKSVTADVVFDGTWDTTADSVTLTSLAVSAPEMGKVTVSGKVSGFSARRLSDPAAAKEARAGAALDGVTVRFDNAGFVEHMLDMQAQMLGGTRDDVRTQLTTAALPFFLGFVKNAAFRDSAQQAIGAFLATPHSLTITSAAPAPVPLGEAMRSALHAPGTIPDLLGLTITANN